MSKKRKIPTCPLCERDREVKFRPFCSSRCRDLDLSKWFDGSYAVPVVEDDELDLYEDDPSRSEDTRTRPDDDAG